MRSLKLALLCLFLVSCGGSGGQDLLAVKVFGRDGTLRREFQAELADDPAERSQGLMWRQELGKDRGMLFIFPQDTEGPFWMKNTLISLDIIFISADKKVVSLVERATPQTTSPRAPEGPYRYVLEINGGRSSELGIQAGDAVEFQIP
ncbi:MAG TPA: DUF192 domain-containing protein [bacterium]|nr:DUF192 domain-containing protein [bacterium]